MGWSSGSELAGELVGLIKQNVPDKKARRTIYRKMIDIFEANDCDTLCECLEIDDVYDTVYFELYPSDED